MIRRVGSRRPPAASGDLNTYSAARPWRGSPLLSPAVRSPAARSPECYVAQPDTLRPGEGLRCAPIEREREPAGNVGSEAHGQPQVGLPHRRG
eukprot:scaffold121_cov412-Prasinococcus_capsulatus_cf.AAC.18